MKLKKELVPSLKWLFHLANYKSIISFLLFIILGLLQGVSVFMIVPLLSLLGVGQNNSETKLDKIQVVFQKIGIPITIYSVVILFFCFVLSHALLKLYSTNLNATIVQDYANRLRKRLHVAILESKWKQIIESRSSDIIGVLSRDVNQVAFAVSSIFQLLSNVILVLIHIFIAAYISIKFTFIVLSGAGIIFFFQRKLFTKSFEKGKRVNFSMKELQHSLQELFQNIKQAKSMGANKQQAIVFDTISDSVYNTNQQMSREKTVADFSFEIAGALLICGFLIVVFYIKLHHVIDLLLLMYLFSRIFPGLKYFNTQSSLVFSLMPIVGEVKNKLFFLESQSEDLGQINAVPSLKKEIKIKNVSFSYPQKSIFNSIDLIIPANKITVISGSSGEGKSTLADLITGLHEPNEGEILIDDKTIEQIGLANWRQVISYMPQESFLMHESIRANFKWAAPNVTDEQIWKALEDSEAKEFVSLLPEGIDAIVGDKGTKLSGGQRQRIALARALVRKPKLLILDEATNALDEENERKIFDTIFKLKETSVLIITHRKSLLEKADLAYTLEKGIFNIYKSSIS